MPRVLSAEQLGALSVAFTYAALDSGFDPQAVIAAWSDIGAAMPLAADLVGLAVQRRPAISADVADMIERIREQDRNASPTAGD